MTESCIRRIKKKSSTNCCNILVKFKSFSNTNMLDRSHARKKVKLILKDINWHDISVVKVESSQPKTLSLSFVVLRIIITPVIATKLIFISTTTCESKHQQLQCWVSISQKRYCKARCLFAILYWQSRKTRIYKKRKLYIRQSHKNNHAKVHNTGWGKKLQYIQQYTTRYMDVWVVVSSPCLYIYIWR